VDNLSTLSTAIHNATEVITVFSVALQKVGKNPHRLSTGSQNVDKLSTPNVDNLRIRRVLRHSTGIKLRCSIYDSDTITIIDHF
jgi:hypothetical protein